jgi:hypothetical protein
MAVLLPLLVVALLLHTIVATIHIRLAGVLVGVTI